MEESFIHLSRCPFCNAGEDRLVDLWNSFDAGHIAHVHCEQCGADGPSIYQESPLSDLLIKARKAWNRRLGK